MFVGFCQWLCLAEILIGAIDWRASMLCSAPQQMSLNLDHKYKKRRPSEILQLLILCLDQPPLRTLAHQVWRLVISEQNTLLWSLQFRYKWAVRSTSLWWMAGATYLHLLVWGWLAFLQSPRGLCWCMLADHGSQTLPRTFRAKCSKVFQGFHVLLV